MKFRKICCQLACILFLAICFSFDMRFIYQLGIIIITFTLALSQVYSGQWEEAYHVIF